MKKSTETNIEKLKRQRRLNVQEQILLKKYEIKQEAEYWRDKGIPEPLEKIFADKGVEINKYIILNYSQDYPGISTDDGIILTPEGTFYEFEADLNPNRTKLVEMYSFIDVSDKYEIKENKKGVGKTYGFLAMEVLNELNQKE